MFPGRMAAGKFPKTATDLTVHSHRRAVSKGEKWLSQDGPDTHLTITDSSPSLPCTAVFFPVPTLTLSWRDAR